MRATGLESALQKVSRVITDQYGLRLVCEGDRCRTDGRTIYLPSLPDNVPEQILGAIRGWADHECAHAIYTQTKLGPKFQKEHGSEAFTILNALEDARVERLMARRFPGARINLEEGFRFVGDRVSEGELQARSPFDQFTTALYTRAGQRPDQSWISREGYMLADLCEPELEELRSCRKTRDVGQLALRIWEKFRAEESTEKQSEPSPPGPAGRAGPGTGSGSAGPEPPPQSPEDDGECAPTPPEWEPGSSPMDILGPLLQAGLEQLHSSQGGQYCVYSTQHDVVEVPPNQTGFDYRQEMAELGPYVSGLRRRLLQSLLGRRETLWLGDRARGRLDPRSLHRLVTGRSGRVFRRRVATEGQNTACTLLLDISSSMSGPSIDLCRKLALVFAETLEVLGFPTEVVGFSTLDDDVRGRVAQETGMPEEELAKRYSRFVPLYHALYKQFGEPWRKAAGRIGAVQTRSLTPLGESLLFAGRRLASRPESRKVLFCLTDGKPVVGAWDEQVTFDHSCQCVQRLSKAGIEPVGIGIMEACVTGIFPHHAVIHRLEELPQAFIRELCRTLGSR